MKQQYIRLFAFLLGIAFILSGVIFALTKMYKDNRTKKIEEEKIVTDEIGDVYKTFFELESELTASRDELMKKFSSYITFYADMPKGYSGIKEMIQSYETKVTEIEDASSFLAKKCVDKYSVHEANDKCIAYYRNLEMTINVFVGDLEFFNSKIKEFNAWTEEENKSVLMTAIKYDKLEEFVSTKYTEYVDLNKDGTYLGQNAD